MKCPYCAEEIKDEAVVCRHCRQNLMDFKPLVDKISQLEQQIADMAASINDLQSRTQFDHTLTANDQIGVPYQPVLAALILPILVSLVAYWFNWTLVKRGTEVSRLVFIAVVIISPLPFGVWLGLTLRNVKLKTYPLLGLGVGVIIGIGVQTIYYVMWGRIAQDAVPGFVMFALGAAFLYMSGEFIGAWIKRKKQPGKDTPSYALKLARKLVGDKGTSDASGTKRLSEIIAALAPIMTFLGSLIGAYLTYRAAISKNK